MSGRSVGAGSFLGGETLNEEFKLYRTAASMLRVGWLQPVVLAVGLLALGSLALSQGTNLGAAVAFLAVCSAAVGFAFCCGLRLPTRIELGERGHLVLHGTLGKRELEATEILSIKPRGNQPGILALRRSGGRIYLLNQFDGFHRFLTRLEELNPTIEMRGC